MGTGAPIGNKYAVGNNGGRPRIYSNAEDLIREVDAYFEYIKGERKEAEDTTVNEQGIIDFADNSDVGQWVRYPEPATVTGLSLYLGFGGRQSMYDYAKSSEFSYIIKAAISRVEHEYEKGLRMDKSATGSIFALKNMGWKDKTEQELTGPNGTPLVPPVQQHTVVFKKMSDDNNQDAEPDAV